MTLAPLDFEMFEAVGIHATLGLAWFWCDGGQLGRRPIYEYKHDGRHARPEYYKVSERKIGRWIRRGLLPKPGKRKA